MKHQKLLDRASVSFIIFSMLSISTVSLMALMDPQSVMDLVHVKLPNNDAYGSIRGVYGGVGVAIVINLIMMLRQNIKNALLFLSLLWGLYAVSRLITIFAEGALGPFGRQWLLIESVLCCGAIVLLLLQSGRKKSLNYA